MSDFLYAIVINERVLTAARLPEVADPDAVLESFILYLYHFNHNALCYHYCDYSVVTEEDAVFEEAEYRVFRLDAPKEVDLRDQPTLRDLQARFFCEEMDYRINRTFDDELKDEVEDDEAPARESPIHVDSYEMVSCAIH